MAKPTRGNSMKIVAKYDFNNGKSVIETRYPTELQEIVQTIERIDSAL